MARSKATPVNDATENGNEGELDTSLLTTAPDDWEFETVAEESAITVILDTPGDQFIGQYIGSDHIEPENGGEAFDRFVYRGRDSRLYAMNKSYKLEQAMEKVELQQWVRITLVKEIETKRALQPMKDFRVEVRRG
jgi:hypothetical protein